MWPFLLGRILPDPVAMFFVVQGFASHAAVVFFVPADRVERELSIFGTAIFVRLAGEEIVGQSGDELRDEGFQVLGKLTFGQPVSFQRASQRRLIGGGLCSGRSPDRSSEGGQKERCYDTMADDGA